MELDINSIQSKVTQCIKSDCPQAANCLRQIVRQQCTAELAFIRIVNPDAVQPTADGCQYFKSTEGVPYGVGFDNYLSQLTMPEARSFRKLLYSYFNNRMQYNRYRTGQLKVSPERREEMNSILAANGFPTPIEFDDVVYEYE